MKMHVAINVRNLERSLSFYAKLFHAEPTKVKDNYAKFELENPALHFSLNVRPFDNQGVLNHFGFQVKTTEDVLALKERLQEAGLAAWDEMNTTCCYAVQDKIWVTDPEGNPWEVFCTIADSEHEAGETRASQSACCVLPSPGTVQAEAAGKAGSSCC